MTIEAGYFPIGDAGNGVTTTFSIPWPFRNWADVVVQLLDSVTGVPIPGAPPAPNGGGTYDYAVVGVPDPDTGYCDSGDIVFNTAPPATMIVWRSRVTENEQDKVLPTNGRFPAKSVESALDRRTIISQEQDYELTRTVHAPASDTGGDLTLPPVDPNAPFLGRDPAGNIINMTGPPPAGVPVAVPYLVVLSSPYPTLAAADAAAQLLGGVLDIDKHWTLTANTTLNAKGIRFSGGYITLGSFTLHISGEAWAPCDQQIFELNGTGLVTGAPGGPVYAAWFGVKDGIECAKFINGAIHYARVTVGGAGNRKVWLASGTFKISAQIVTYNGVSVEGQGTEATVLALSATFPELTTRGLLCIGDGTMQVYGTMVTNLTVELYNSPGAIGLYTRDAQNGTGFAHFGVNNVQGKGVWFNGMGGGAGFCNNIMCFDGYVEKGDIGGDGGTAYEFDGGTLAGTVDNLAATCAGAFNPDGTPKPIAVNKFAKCYYIHSTAFEAGRLGCDSGTASVANIDIGTANLYVSIATATILAQNPIGLRIANDPVRAKLDNYYYSGGGSAVVDAGGGTARPTTMATALGGYTRNQHTYINGYVNMAGLPGASSEPFDLLDAGAGNGTLKRA